MRIGKRRISVRLETIDGIAIEINAPGADVGNTQLEVDLSVNMSVSPAANSAMVSIMNLSRSTRQMIAGRIKRNLDISAATIDLPVDYTSVAENPIVQQTVTKRGDCYVLIDAGYDDFIPRAFEGSCQYTRHVKQGPTWVTSLQVGDGLSTMMAGVAARTFPPGSLYLDVLRYLVRLMALDDSVLKTPLQLTDAIGRGNTVFKYGITLSGDARWAVSNMLEPFGAEWFVDRGQFFVVRKGHALPEPAVTVDFFSGLMHTPEPIENGGVRIRSMFRSDIRIGRPIIVSGVDYEGEYRADNVMHRMNNRYGEAITEAILMPIEVA
jgi:hypothetical protein